MVAVVPIDPWMHRQRPALLRMMALTESPAEALLLPALLALGGPEAHFFGPAGIWQLDAQVTVPTRARTYRVDFAATLDHHRVAVEVDGYAAHRANEEQIAYDHARDLALKDKRWAVIRIEATAVFSNPMEAAGRVSTRLADLDSGRWDPFFVPAVDRTNEDFAKVVEKIEAAAQEAETAGFYEVAAQNREKIHRLTNARSARSLLERLRRPGSFSGAEAENEALRQLFESRRAT